MRILATMLLIFAISLTLLQSGCQKRVSSANVDAVNRLYENAEKSSRFLTEKEVQSVLGQPKKVEKFTMTRQAIKEYPGERHIYEQDGKQIVLLFVDGKLSEKVLNFGEEPPQSPDEAQAPLHRTKPVGN